MIIDPIKKRLAVLVLAIGFGLTLPVSWAKAAEPPVKEIEASHFGWKVGKGGANFCTEGELKEEECQEGTASGEPGGFEYPEAVAVTSGGSMFVADRGNYRIQEIETNGKFVAMFGRKVNKKGGDLCIAGEECQAGEAGSAPGEFTEGLQDIALDAASGDVYVAEQLPNGADRVQEIASTGQFVLEIGRKVNAKGGNLCTAAELANCVAPAPGSLPEPGAFTYQNQSGKNILTVGGPQDLLYVGDEHRVQEFDAKAGAGNGVFKGEIGLTSISAAAGAHVTDLAVNQTNGIVYLVYAQNLDVSAETIREFNASGTQIGSFRVGVVLATAVDSAGRLAVSEFSGGKGRGSLYEEGEPEIGVHTLHLITRFVTHGTSNLSFGAKDEMFAAFGEPTSVSGPVRHEVILWRPVNVAELKVGSTGCVEGAEHNTDVTFNCTLSGTVDPLGVPHTKVWFDWGRTSALDTETQKVEVCGAVCGGAPIPVSAGIEGVLPSETLYDELLGEDDSVKAPEEPLTSSTIEKSATPTAPPRILGQPIAGLQTPTSSVFFGRLNPENTSTGYEFQYAREADCDGELLVEGKGLAEACTGVSHTGEAHSSQYGPVSAALEGTGLQPATIYRFRMYAVNNAGQGAVGETGGTRLPEGTFETASAPVVSALTGEASSITTTSAVISGSVNPDGQSSVYTFEVGVDDGASTLFGTVVSAPAGTGTRAVSKQVNVTGLQPATAYAYRIAVHFGDGSTLGSSATGATRTFETLGLPEVLVSPPAPPIVAVPSVAFPGPVKATIKKKQAKARVRKGKSGRSQHRMRKHHRTKTH